MKGKKTWGDQKTRNEVPGIENCDLCRFASKKYLSDRLLP